MVVVARASTLQEADLLRALLAGAGIDARILNEHIANTLSHLLVATNPHGIELAVPAADARRAAAVIARAQRRRRRASPLGPDDLAREAALWAVLLCWFPPIGVLIAFRLREAFRLKQTQPASRPTTFGLCVAVAVLGIAASAAIAIGLLVQLVGAVVGDSVSW